MPRVTIPGVGDVNFPDNMSRDEIMSRATAMRDQAAQPLLPLVAQLYKSLPAP